MSFIFSCYPVYKSNHSSQLQSQENDRYITIHQSIWVIENCKCERMIYYHRSKYYEYDNNQQ